MISYQRPSGWKPSLTCACAPKGESRHHRSSSWSRRRTAHSASAASSQQWMLWTMPTWGRNRSAIARAMASAAAEVAGVSASSAQRSARSRQTAQTASSSDWGWTLPLPALTPWMS
ncbi:hypothetical protein [Nonomuraea recticatena]|uniref:hypothetical protein n=1 Tax=Nonomuraea recticatena TaxID=46178 RepID=UPI003610F5F2